MNLDSVQDSTRYVVSEEHPGAILPGKYEEMQRDVFLRPGAQVRGGVFGRHVSATGRPIEVDASVYAAGSVSIGEPPDARDASGGVTFGGTICADSVVFEEHCDYQVRFLADIFADRINVHDSLIRGNVYARDAVLRNCVVLGGVFCSGTLTLENVIIGTFRARDVRLSRELMMFYPFAMAEEPIKLSFPVKALSFMNLREVLGGAEYTGDGVVFLDESDVVPVSEQVDGETRQYSMISLGARILDLEEAKKHFTQNKDILEYVSLGDHFDRDSKHDFELNELADIEDALFQLLGFPPQQERVKTVPMAEMRERESVKRYREEMTAAAARADIGDVGDIGGAGEQQAPPPDDPASSREATWPPPRG